MSRKTIVAEVAEHRRRHPDKPALVAGKRSVSYEDLWARTQAAAVLLRELGVGPGDCVVLGASATQPAFVFGYLACHLLGAIAVPIDPQPSKRRLDHIVTETRARRTFVPKPAMAGRADARPIDELDVEPRGELRAETPVTEDQVADILFTTGTTGEPKGVVLTHGNIRSAAESICAFIGNTEEDREVVPLPLSHSFGLGRLRCNLLQGGTIILTSGFAFPGQIGQAIEAWQATGLASVPAGLAVLLGLADGLDRFAAQLRYIEIGSAPMPLEHKRKLMELLPRTRICMHYGLTEASRTAFIEFHESSHKLESVGRPSPRTRIRVVGEDGQEQPVGTSGEILVSGGAVMRGYHGAPEAAAACFDRGWLRTGDRGHFDEDGYLYFEARETEMINVGGLKVAPPEVERELAEHPAIAACACVAIADPKGVTGQAVKAFVVRDPRAPDLPSERELRGFLRDRVEAYKIPVAYEWIDSIPTAPSGKLLRLKLRDGAGR